MIRAFREYLSQYPDLTDDDIRHISTIGKVRSYDKKVVVTNVGENEMYIYLVIQGLVRKYFFTGNKENITQIAKEGEFINSSVSFISGEPSEYIIETIEPTIFISFSREDIDALMSENIKFKKIIRTILMHLLVDKEKWEFNRLAYTTQERFAMFIRNHSELFQRVPQKFLASYLNIQPETFSRLKHTLKKA